MAALAFKTKIGRTGPPDNCDGFRLPWRMPLPKLESTTQQRSHTTIATLFDKDAGQVTHSTASQWPDSRVKKLDNAGCGRSGRQIFS